MIKIGEFSKMFNVSIKTVRFYEDRGLIIPAYTDIYSSYRYYDEDNIYQMSRILFLKELGFSLSEIVNFDENSYKDKISEYENKIKMLYKSIDTLKSLSNNKERGKNIMKTFINDESAIGKWKLVGCVKTKEDFYKSEFLSDDESVNIKELYLMENGMEYWVISWTKDIIYVCGNANPYEIKDNLMFVKFVSPVDENDYKYAVYEKIDSEKYSTQDFMIKDDINVNFVSDEKLKGIWKSVDLVPNKDAFNPSNKFFKEKNLFLDKLIVSPDEDVIVSFSNNKSKHIKYTKDYFINLCASDTLSKYEIVNINDKTYMIMEWKSGDYVYAGQINCYYVLEKVD